MGSAVSAFGALTVTDATIADNTAIAGDGGAGAAGAPGGVGAPGGAGGAGGYAFGALVGSPLTLTRVAIVGNRALGGQGGAGGAGTGFATGGTGGKDGEGSAAAFSGGMGSTIVVRDSLIANNVSVPGPGGTGGAGGAMGGDGGDGGIASNPTNGGAVFSNGVVRMTNVTLTGNVAGAAAGGGGGHGGLLADGGAGGAGFGGQGGAIALMNMNGASATLASVTIADNRAETPAAAPGGVGGGGAGAPGTVYKSSGGNIELYNASLRLGDSIVSGGVAGTAAAANCSISTAMFTDGGHNIDSTHSCIATAVNGDKSDTSPLLGALADNGGPTATMALGAGSPAIGGAPACTDDGGFALTSDQRGLPRSSPCDIGAFEGQPPAIAPPVLGGSATAGSSLTCTATVTGDQPLTIAFQWTRDGSVLPGQTAGAYPVPAADVGHAVACRESVANPYGTASADSAALTIAAVGARTAPGTPLLSKLSFSPSTVGRGHAERVRFTLSIAAARVTFKLQRLATGIKVGKRCLARSRTHPRGTRCTRFVPVSRAPKAIDAKLGANSVAWTPSSRLALGRYRLAATPAGGATSTKTFTLHAATKQTHHS